MEDYPKFTWDRNIGEQLTVVRSNMTEWDLAKFKNRSTPIIIDDYSPTLNWRKYMLLRYLSRKYNIKPTFNPAREHWLIRLVNDYVDGKITNIEEFVEREKKQDDKSRDR